MRRVLAVLEHSNISALLMKGVTLAYSCYPRRFLRPRLETDLLIRRQDLDVVSQLMSHLRYGHRAEVSGDLVMLSGLVVRKNTSQFR